MVQGSSIKIRIDNPYVIHRIEPTSLAPCIAILEYLAENMNIDKSKVDDWSIYATSWKCYMILFQKLSPSNGGR